MQSQKRRSRWATPCVGWNEVPGDEWILEATTIEASTELELAVEGIETALRSLNAVLPEATRSAPLPQTPAPGGHFRQQGPFSPSFAMT